MDLFDVTLGLLENESGRHTQWVVCGCIGGARLRMDGMCAPMIRDLFEIFGRIRHIITLSLVRYMYNYKD